VTTLFGTRHSFIVRTTSDVHKERAVSQSLDLEFSSVGLTGLVKRDQQSDNGVNLPIRGAAMTLTDSESRLEFFQQVPTPILDELSKIARHRQFAPAGVLFREGTIHHDFHLIVQGHVRLDMSVPNRGRIPLLTVGPGDILAWSAIVADEVMTCSAIALEQVMTLVFEGNKLRQLCKEHPELGYHVMKQLARALSRRLLATRLQLLDLFADHQPALETLPASDSLVDDQC
jgi:CRP/FNR family transcriptional regulator, cyclic AMP receptor protein